MVRVITKPVAIREKLPNDTANPRIRVGKISLIITHTIGPNEKAKLATYINNGIITNLEPMANKTPTPDKEMNAPIAPINSSFLLPNFSIFIIATKVNAQFTMPTKTAPKKALSTL